MSNDLKNNDKIKEYVLFQINRKITDLFKSFLNTIEDLRDDQYNISETRMQKMRKRTLDAGNECIRELEEYFSKLDVKLK